MNEWMREWINEWMNELYLIPLPSLPARGSCLERSTKIKMKTIDGKDIIK